MIDRTSAKSTLILGCLFAQLRVPAGAPTTGRLLADLHDLGNVGDAFQRLDVRVDQYALDSRHVWSSIRRPQLHPPPPAPITLFEQELYPTHWTGRFD